MRRLLFRVAGVCLAPLLGLALAGAAELDGKTTGKPVKPIAPEKTEATCGSHGTRVEFVDTPKEAADLAKKQEKLVFVLHLSGVFEDPGLT